MAFLPRLQVCSLLTLKSTDIQSQSNIVGVRGRGWSSYPRSSFTRVIDMLVFATETISMESTSNPDGTCLGQ